MGTAGGAPVGTTLTSDEEKVLSIIGKMASESISGGIDAPGDKGLSESEDEEEPSGNGAGICTPPGKDDPPQPCPVPTRQPAGPSVRMWGGLVSFSTMYCMDHFCIEMRVSNLATKSPRQFVIYLSVGS